MRRIVMGLLVGLAACNEPAPQAWRACDEAFEQLVPLPSLPIIDDTAPIEVGDALPRLRMTAIDDDADALANRVLAMACILDPEVSSTPALRDWAEASLADDSGGPSATGVFDNGLRASRSTASSVLTHLSLSRGADPQEVNGAVDDLDAIGDDAATEIATDVMRSIVDHGLLASTGFELVRSTYRLTQCSWREPSCVRVVESYERVFRTQFGGISIGEAPVAIEVSRKGEVLSIQLDVAQLAPAGSVPAEMTEAQAEARLLEILAQDYPDADIRPDLPGGVGYRPPRVDEPAEVEPVWVVGFYANPLGASGRSSRAYLRLSDADGPLLDYY